MIMLAINGGGQEEGGDRLTAGVVMEGGWIQYGFWNGQTQMSLLTFHEKLRTNTHALAVTTLFIGYICLY